MKFWQALSFTEVDQLVGVARICEEVGFHGVFVSDHVIYPEEFEPRYPYSEDGRPLFDAATEWADPWVAIAAMATATERLHFTTGVYLAPLRHPLQVAKSVGIASILSGGRTALGAAVGWMREEFEILGQDFGTRGRRLDEIIAICKEAWSGSVFEYHGEHYAIPRVTMTPAPRSSIPVYIGGASPAALRRAACNDGWIGTGNDPREVPGILERLNAFRSEAGRSEQPFEVIVALTTPPDFDEWRSLEALGVTSLISYPLSFAIGTGSSLEQKRDALERYADEVIARY